VISKSLSLTSILFVFFISSILLPISLYAKISKSEREISTGIPGLNQLEITTTTSYKENGSGDWLKPNTEYKFKSTNGLSCEVSVDFAKSTFKNCKVIYKSCFAMSNGEWSTGQILIEALGSEPYEFHLEYKVNWREKKKEEVKPNTTQTSSSNQTVQNQSSQNSIIANNSQSNYDLYLQKQQDMARIQAEQRRQQQESANNRQEEQRQREERQRQERARQQQEAFRKMQENNAKQIADYEQTMQSIGNSIIRNMEISNRISDATTLRFSSKDNASSSLSKYRQQIAEARVAYAERKQAKMAEWERLKEEANQKARSGNQNDAIATGIASLAMLGSAAFNDVGLKDDLARMEKQFNAKYDKLKEELIEKNSGPKKEFEAAAAKAASMNSQKYYDNCVAYYQCNIDHINRNFDYDSDGWATPNCREPEQGSSSFSSKDEEYLTLAKLKYDRYKSGGEYSSTYFKMAEDLTDAAISSNNNNAEAFFFKTKFISDSFDKLLCVFKACQLAPSNTTYSSAKAELFKEVMKDFFTAIRNNNQSYIDRVVKMGLHQSMQDENGNTPIMYCIVNNNRSAAEVLIKFDRSVISSSNGQNLLNLAISNNAGDCIKLLLENGVSAVFEDGVSNNAPLFNAAACGYLDIMDLLKSKGADVYKNFKFAVNNKKELATLNLARLYFSSCLTANGLNKFESAYPLYADLLHKKYADNETFASYAVKSNNLPLISFMLNKGLSANSENLLGEKLILIAAENCQDNKITKKLIEKKPDLNVANRNGSNLLHLAVISNNKYLTDLVSAGMPVVNYQDQNGKTALLLAVEKKSPLFSVILAKKPDINIADNNCTTSLMAAIKSENPVFKQLLSMNPLIDLVDNEGNSALHFAAANKSEVMANQLLEMNPDVDLINKSGNTALFNAFESGNKAAEKIMDRVKNVDYANNEGNTALMLAVKHNYPLDKLLSKSPNLNLQNRSGQTTLMLAFINNNPNTKQLITLKPDVNIVDPQAKSILHYATENKNADLVAEILNAGGNADLQDSTARLPLHISAAGNDFECSEILVKKTTKINAQDKKGNTAMHYAAMNNNMPLVRLLLLNGAKTNVKNLSGEAIKEIATQNNNTEILDILSIYTKQEIVLKSCVLPGWGQFSSGRKEYALTYGAAFWSCALWYFIGNMSYKSSQSDYDDAYDDYLKTPNIVRLDEMLDLKDQTASKRVLAKTALSFMLIAWCSNIIDAAILTEPDPRLKKYNLEPVIETDLDKTIKVGLNFNLNR